MTEQLNVQQMAQRLMTADNGSDFAYQGGAYNQYAFTQQENGEVTMKMMKEGYERPYKKIEYIFVGK